MKRRWRRAFSIVFILALSAAALVLFGRDDAPSLLQRLFRGMGAPPGLGVSGAPKTMPFKYDVGLIKLFSFADDNSLKEWEKKIFKGEVVYKIEGREDLSYVRAISEGKASALYYKIKLDARKNSPVVGWRWRVDKFPAKSSPESLEAENEDDFAARVYVIFMAKFIPNSKVLEYIWAETLPEGTVGTSPYSKNIKLIVLRSGKDENGEWHQEERDVIKDYLEVFGKPPEHDIGAIAFMTNTEHTKTTAEAMYDDISLGYKEDNATKGSGG